MQRVETAQLSLAAIMAKFPEDLRKLVLKMPPAETMVVMPLPAIQKALPTGSVRMSLASVVRQAPPGTFATINPQDKRMVDVPLAEIFKRIPPALLKKRTDQKYSDLAAEGFDIFGDEENPHALAPRVEGAPQEAVAPPPPAFGAPKILKMPPGMVAAPPPNVPIPMERPPATVLPMPTSMPAPAAFAAQRAAAPRAAAPPPEIPALFSRQAVPAQPASPAPKTPAPAPKPAAPAGDMPPLVLPVKELAAHWPEPIKSEVVAFNGATVALPAAEVSAGLAKGKVAFAWGQIRAWLTPPPTGESQAGEGIELMLPLRVIAPAFLKHSKPGGAAPRKAEVGDIPELFAGGLVPPPKPAVPEPVAAPEPEVVPEPEAEAVPEPQADVVSEPEVSAEAPAIEESVVTAEAPAAEVAPAIEPTPEETSAEVVDEAPAAIEPAEEKIEVESPGEAQPEIAAAEVAAKASIAAESVHETAPAESAAPTQTLGEIFGQPDKTSWLPTEVVKHLSEVPGVAGSLVALQEGLVIAHRLPEPFKGEVFAAFLPQIFARLNQYSGEMKLGGVSELVIHANDRPCHLFRRGQVYFAALGQPNATLPLHVLRLCADAVAS